MSNICLNSPNTHAIIGIGMGIYSCSILYRIINPSIRKRSQIHGISNTDWFDGLSISPMGKASCAGKGTGLRMAKPCQKLRRYDRRGKDGIILPVLQYEPMQANRIGDPKAIRPDGVFAHDYSAQMDQGNVS